MRNFIQTCAALFVILGMVAFAIAGLLLIMTFARSSAFDLIGVFGAVFSAAGVTMVGGAAYMLCSIDARLEAMPSGGKAGF